MLVELDETVTRETELARARFDGVLSDLESSTSLDTRDVRRLSRSLGIARESVSIAEKGAGSSCG